MTKAGQIAPIISTPFPVTLVGGGHLNPTILEEVLHLAPDLVAADGGANVLVELGHRPRAVIGDFDSISDETKAELDPLTLFPMADQDSTDFDKCLRSINAPYVLAVGFTGGRLDHQLGTVSVLARHTDMPLILVSETDIAFMAPWDITLDLRPGARVSLYPMRAARGKSKGLHWPINGIDMAPDGAIGTLNKTYHGDVVLRFEKLDEAQTHPGVMIILEYAELRAALKSLGLGVVKTAAR